MMRRSRRPRGLRSSLTSLTSRAPPRRRRPPEAAQQIVPQLLGVLPVLLGLRRGLLRHVRLVTRRRCFSIGCGAPLLRLLVGGGARFLPLAAMLPVGPVL